MQSGGGSLKDINNETEDKGSSSASSRRLPVSAKAEHSAFERVKSDLVVEQVFEGQLEMFSQACKTTQIC